MQKQRTARSPNSATTSQETTIGKRSVSLNIAGQRLSIRTDKDAEYLQRLVDYVDTAIEELRTNAKSASTHQLLLLASLSIADELFEEQSRAEAFKVALLEKTGRLIGMLETSGE